MCSPVPPSPPLLSSLPLTPFSFLVTFPRACDHNDYDTGDVGYECTADWVMSVTADAVAFARLFDDGGRAWHA